MRNRATLTSAETQKMMAACKAEAKKNAWHVSIAIVDESGSLLLFERFDAASALTASVALGKAQASAALQMPSGYAADRFSNLPASVNLPVGLLLQGAVPVVYQGECVGAIGVSGAAAADDEQVARAGAAII
jgi:glc operon protein GlcG